MTVAIKNNNKTPLVVPPAVRRRAGFKSGQELEIKASGGVITILTTSTRRNSDAPSTVALRQARKITKKAGPVDRLKHTRSSSPPCTRKPGSCAARKSKPEANDPPLLKAFPPQLFQSAKSGPRSFRQTIAVLTPRFTSPIAPCGEVRRSSRRLAGSLELHVAFLFQDRRQRLSGGRDQAPREITKMKLVLRNAWSRYHPVASKAKSVRCGEGISKEENRKR